MNPEETTKVPEQPPRFIALTAYSDGHMIIDNDDSAEALAIRTLIEVSKHGNSDDRTAAAAKLLDWIAHRVRFDMDSRAEAKRREREEAAFKKAQQMLDRHITNDN